TIGGAAVTVARVDLTGPDGFLIASPRADTGAVRTALLEAGAVAVGPDAVESARIERGWPLFGRDISQANLPQEVARDERAINLNKGCYLGQETVARIDALGHVNRRLVGVQFSGEAIPAAGTELLADDKNVGKVTSAAWSPRLDAPLSLAYVRRGHDAPGTDLETSYGAATVVALPAADA
ncbi:MAG: glycine cleavage T C-terminal barrel domain-containing protein, partial [Pirellulales bacterium]